MRSPIDPEKRARVSTSDAVRPSAVPIQGDGVIGGGVMRTSEIPLKTAAVGDRRAAIKVEDTREKKMIRTDTRAYSVRAKDADRRQRASDLPASIPRISQERFTKIITAYQKGRIPARDLVQGEIQVGEERVDLGDINRYANPRRVLEQQGIPVRQAGQSSEGAPAGATPVPFRPPESKK